MFQFPEIAKQWHGKSNILVLLSVPNEQTLKTIITELNAIDIKHTAFVEPDLNNALTAITLEPTDKTAEYCRQFKLAKLNGN